MSRLVLMDPSYEAFNADKLFEVGKSAINRDNQLAAYARAKEDLNEIGSVVHTFDMFQRGQLDVSGYEQIDYFSFGLVRNFCDPCFKDLSLKAFVMMEPPTVLPGLYQRLPELSSVFQSVYLPNTYGDQYETNGVDLSRLKQIYWPISYNMVDHSLWNNTSRSSKLVVINGNHKPLNRTAELYSERIRLIVELQKLNYVDLWGRGWDKLLSRSSLWAPFLKNYQKIQSVFRGVSASKYETLSQYEFCLCFENTKMNGYVSEKIFDCFVAGTIPIYLGAPDVTDLIARDAFIDFRDFSGGGELKEYLDKLTPKEKGLMKIAGKRFLESKKTDKFFNFVSELTRV